MLLFVAYLQFRYSYADDYANSSSYLFVYLFWTKLFLVFDPFDVVFVLDDIGC